MLTTHVTGDVGAGGRGHGPSWLPLPSPAATSALAGGQPWRWEGRAVPATCAGVGDAPLQPGEEDGLEEGFLYLGACGAEVVAESVAS